MSNYYCHTVDNKNRTILEESLMFHRNNLEILSKLPTYSPSDPEGAE